MNHAAQRLFSSVLGLMPSGYQKESLRALMGLFLSGDGIARAERSEHKSASAVSRFLNVYGWNTRSLIRCVRGRVLEILAARCDRRRGAKPRLVVMIDLTSVGKEGKFAGLPLFYLHKKWGLHLVVMYLMVDGFRIPWSLRVWRGRGTTTISQLGLKLLHSLPEWLHKRYKVVVLADGGFGDETFIKGLQHRGLQGIVGIRDDRRLQGGGNIQQIRHKGTRVVLYGMKSPVWLAWFRLPKPDGGLDTRYLVATFPASGATILRWARKRWWIEAFFKTCKSRFSLNCFGQRSTRGTYRFILLLLLAFLLTHWQVISLGKHDLPDWRRAALHLRDALIPDLLYAHHEAELHRLKPILDSFLASG